METSWTNEARFYIQFDCCVCFALVTTTTKQVPRYTRYRGIFFTVNTVDEILSTAHPYYLVNGDQSMWAERERQNFRSPLKPISVTSDPRSVPRSATSRSRSRQFFSYPLTAPLPLTRCLARSAPVPLRSCSNIFQAANWKRGGIFTARAAMLAQY